MPDETIGDVEHVTTADHPPRTDSPEYKETRKWLMTTPGGCYVCGGPVDMSHPSAPETTNIQDHHGGGIFLTPEHGEPILVGFNLIGLEWSLGWGADPAKVSDYIKVISEVSVRLGGKPYTGEIATTSDVMAFVDSTFNANVKLCAQHHVAHEDKHTPDINGHEAVGIHNGPVPIWLGQATCDWPRVDMWGGSTGTICVAPHQDGSKKVNVLYVSPLHPDQAMYAAHVAGQLTELPASHPNARLCHAGAHVET